MSVIKNFVVLGILIVYVMDFEYIWDNFILGGSSSIRDIIGDNLYDCFGVSKFVMLE